MIPTWQRAHFAQTDGMARAHFVVFTERPDELDVAPALDGAPGGAETVPIRTAARRDVEFLQQLRGLVKDAVAVIGKPDMDRILRVPAAQLMFEVPDPSDHLPLQVAVAICHAFARAPATAAIVDMLTGTLWDPRSFAELAPTRPFNVREHVVSITGTESTNTRGMAKFARPDVLVRGVRPEHHVAAGRLLNMVAEGFAEGKAWRPGRDAVRFEGPRGKLPVVCFVPPPAEFATEQWGNEYVELCDLGDDGPTPGCTRALEAMLTEA